MRRISPERRAEFLTLNAAGLSGREIAEKMAVHYTTVERWRTKFGAPSQCTRTGAPVGNQNGLKHGKFIGKRKRQNAAS